MWLALMTFSSETGRRCVIPFPMPLLWPLFLAFGVLCAVAALVTFSGRRWAMARCALACLVHLGGASVRVANRHGAAFELRLV